MKHDSVKPSIALQPIGVVLSPFRTQDDVPKGLGARHDEEGRFEIFPEFAAGLEGIEGFSHLYVLWIFDRAGDYELLGKNPTDGLVHGVFATRSPRRPNPLALTVVELLGRDGASLRVRGIDMLDGSPIVDLKPYLSNVPPEKLRRGWLDAAEAAKARPAAEPPVGAYGASAQAAIVPSSKPSPKTRLSTRRGASARRQLVGVVERAGAVGVDREGLDSSPGDRIAVQAFVLDVVRERRCSARPRRSFTASSSKV